MSTSSSTSIDIPDNTHCENIESNDSMVESSMIDTSVKSNIGEDDAVFIDETELNPINKTIWCLEYECIESMETFDTEDLLVEHMKIEHSD